MTRTTDDSGELIKEELDNQIERESDADLKEKSADRAGEKSEPETAAESVPGKEGEEPEDVTGQEGEASSETEAQEAPGEESEASSETEERAGPGEEGEEPQDSPAPTPQTGKSPKKRRKKAPEAPKEDPEEDDYEEEGIGLNLFTFFVLLIAALITVVYYTCTVRTVIVTGNHLYTSEEIAEKVISDDTQLRHNTVFLTALYMTPLAPKIPFEESVTVTPESYDTIRITVKDMDIAGFIPYAGKKLYFSADGTVLENSPLTVKNATFVTGLSVTEAQIGEKMASDNETGQSMILEVLQILRKYQMQAECVVLTDTGNIVMYMDDIKIQLGRTGFELKISKIAQILPYLEGRSGTINMTNYTQADQNIILK